MLAKVSRYGHRRRDNRFKTGENKFICKLQRLSRQTMRKRNSNKGRGLTINAREHKRNSSSETK
jgi:hypothetical protein